MIYIFESATFFLIHFNHYVWKCYRLDLITTKIQVFFFKYNHHAEMTHVSLTLQMQNFQFYFSCAFILEHTNFCMRLCWEGFCTCQFLLNAVSNADLRNLSKLERIFRDCDPLSARFMQIFMNFSCITGNLWKFLFRIFHLLYWHFFKYDCN